MTALPNSLQEANYAVLSTFFQRAGAVISVAELHGMLCGCVCAGIHSDGRAWLEVLLGVLGLEPMYDQEARDVLIYLYEQISADLKSEDCEFGLLLPDDTAPLTDRAKAVGEWCTGLMAGLGLAGVAFEKQTDEDVQEGLYHVSEISQIDYMNLELGENDELTFEELVSYLRVVMIRFYQEFVLAEGAGALPSTDEQSNGNGENAMH